MKKTAKRLVLSKETVASLEASRLSQVAAGISTPEGCTHPCPVSLSCPRIC
jgi:hypothetical protein